MSTKRIRILQVVGGMNRGGVETWLMHVLRGIDRERFQIDFLVHTDNPCAYDSEIRELGSNIIPCIRPSRPLVYARKLRRVLDEDGPYDVVHSHVHHYSGYILRLAKSAAVPVRVAHSHSDTSMLQAQAGLRRRGYLRLMKRWIDRYATVGLAVSRQAAAALFGRAWEADPRWRLLYCGVDLASFRKTVDKRAVRAELGLPADAFVLGHVGSFNAAKNHEFLVDIAVEVAKLEPNMRLLLVGDGPLRPAVEQKIRVTGLADRVVFTGQRGDVPRLMLGTMDAFVLPSRREGLPLVGIEAQAAGLPCVLSDVVTDEVHAVKPLVRRLSLTSPASAWAGVIMQMRSAVSKISQRDALTVIERSPFNIEHGMHMLTEMCYAV